MTPPRLDEGSEREAYPPLPEKSFLGDDASYGYDAEDMRAYVDADRASRAALSTGRLGGEWISVDEQLPEPDVFLAHCQCGGESSGIYTMRLPVLIDKNSRPDGVFNRERVTHWMPLPLPPAPAAKPQGDKS